MNWTEEQLQELESHRMITPHRRKSVPPAIVKKQGRVKGIAEAADRTYAGVVYHSKAEAQMAVKLDILIKAGSVSAWFRQVRFPMRIGGRLDGKWVGTLVADFDVWYSDGTREIIEVKGFETEVYKLKRKLFEVLYPELKYTVVKV